ncbi:MAG: type I DNA topoisomerase [Anaerolineae bacterium]|nr:type I DNA topoisomerase [Anaerolineae bacterium]
MTEEVLQAYCVKCKTKRPLTNAEAVYTKTGTPGTRGTCEVCGTTLFRMGSTPAHDDVPRPEVVEKPKKKVSKKKAKKAAKGKKEKSGASRGRLVIVESPAKARTIQRFLGKKYTVKASVGHVRDLLRSRLSVDVEHDFEPNYRVPNEKRQVVKEIKKAASKAREIYLATDPDREGEAIAWHLIAAADIDADRVKRVVFHEITDEAIAEAFAQPEDVNIDLVNAQQARRILDRLVGYNITELLWDKVRNRLSAGRVQSIASRLVVDREREIENFTPEEYWTLRAELSKQSANGSNNADHFEARLVQIGGDKVEFHVEGDVQPHLAILEHSTYTVSEVKRGTRQRRPAPPFTTSTLQQEASRRLNFNARRTMSVAQQLYEGIDIGTEQVGLITYMRTDSTTIAQEAQGRARSFITSEYGAEYLPETPPIYKTTAKSAQEAHEAIRPTRVTRTPEALKAYLSRDQLRLYKLIWQRFVASQMANAEYTTLRVDILAGPSEEREKPYLFRASGSLLKFQGFLRVYEESRDTDNSDDEDDEGRILPELSEEELLRLIQLLPQQHFTQPPARYTEASLVKALEENGIGRPSTYAPTVAVIQNRDYVTREGKTLVPTETGELVTDLLVKYFPEIMDLNFTARLETQLDAIAEGDQEWVPFLSEFYGPFSSALEHAREQMPSQQQVEYLGRDCPECGSPLVIRYGRFGKFIGCSTYPECRYTEPWLEKIGVSCPVDGGDLVEKRTRRGRIFYGCANYPDCEFTSWKRPLPQPCPSCGGLLVEHNRQHAACTVCEKHFRRDALPDPAEIPTPDTQ